MVIRRRQGGNCRILGGVVETSDGPGCNPWLVPANIINVISCVVGTAVIVIITVAKSPGEDPETSGFSLLVSAKLTRPISWSVVHQDEKTTTKV